MMKRMCDCGCDHAITDYDAGQTPIIVQRGDLLLEVRVLPGPTGERPNVRPVCARAAISEGTMVFPRVVSVVDPAAEEPGARPAPASREAVVREPAARTSEEKGSEAPTPSESESETLVGAAPVPVGNGHPNGGTRHNGKPPTLRPMKPWRRG